jgi:predicted transcriptional regulator YdeE
MKLEDPKILELDRIVLAGFSFFGDPFATSIEWSEENEIGRLWRRFWDYIENNNESILNLFNRKVAYEVHTWNEQTIAKGNFDVFVGMEIEKAEAVHYELLLRVFPPNKYAVFTLKGQDITSDWHKKIYEGWLPKSGYNEANQYQFQYYDHRFKGMDNLDESELDVYIPVL